jgi:hypothetical protein
MDAWVLGLGAGDGDELSENGEVDFLIQNSGVAGGCCERSHGKSRCVLKWGGPEGIEYCHFGVRWARGLVQKSRAGVSR